MPITLRTDILKYKNPNTGLYESVDAITDASTADRVAEIASAGTAQVSAVNNAGTNQINSLNARGNELKNIIIAPTRVADDDGLGIIVEAGTTAATEQRMQEVAASETAAWLDEHIDTTTGYVVDDTLSISGAAADAKKTGDELTQLKSALNDRQAYVKKSFGHVNGTAHSSALDKAFIELKAGKTYILYATDSAGIVGLQFYSDDGILQNSATTYRYFELTPSSNKTFVSVYVSSNQPSGILTFEVYEKGVVVPSDLVICNAKNDTISEELTGGVVTIPRIRNGSYLNTGNATAVCTISTTSVQPGDIVELIINRELPTGHVYIIGYTVERSSGSTVSVSESETAIPYFSNAMPTNAVSVHFNIWERDSPGGALVALRASDFDVDSIIIKIQPRTGSALYRLNNTESLAEQASTLINEIVAAPVLSNGSGGNPGNANGVTARAVPFNDAYAITFINRHPLAQSGNYYRYDISAFRGTAWYTNKITGVSEDTYTFHSADVIAGRTDVDGFGVTIWEYDSNGNYVPLRIADFDNDEFIIRYTYQLEEDENNIVNRNSDMKLAVEASSNYGHNGSSKANVEKMLSLLAVADIHNYETLLQHAADYLDAMPSLDCGIVLGDIMASNYAESDGTWYTSIINNASKIIYTLIGNHDGGNSASGSISGTKQQVFDKFISPVKDKMGMASLTKTYYSVTFSNYKLVLICLDNYDVPDTLSGSDFVVSRRVEALSQEQIDWFISTLTSVPSDYTVVVARHSSAGGTWTVYNCDWTKIGSRMYTSALGYDSLPVNDIIHAWQTGGTFAQSYAPVVTGLPTLSVSCDFSQRGTGKFACYLFGHAHCDTIAYDSFGNLGLQFDTAASGNSQPGNSDLPRVSKTKSEDCVTVVSIDTNRNLVKLVRIGSNVSLTMQDRSFIALPFQQNA